MKRIIFLLILFIGLVLRVFQFGQPIRPVYVDEASLGYNAYSLLKTGKDEYGKSFPIFLRSFGIYQSALYSYFSVLPVSVFGLNEFSVRFASLVGGTLLILILRIAYGKATSLVVAVSPIFIFYSRAAFEANFSLLLLYLGILAIFRLRSRLFYCLGILIVCLSAYTYHSSRFVAPTALVIIFVFLWRRLKKRVVFGVFLSILFLAPLISVSLTPGGLSRMEAVASVDDTSGFVKRTMAYFGPNNLFNKGDPDPQRSYPDTGAFSWWMFPFLLIGLFIVVKQRKLSDLQKILLFVGVISLLPGIITKDYFATIRVLPFLVLIAFVIGRGMSQFKFKYLIVFIILLSGFLQIYSSEILLLHERSRIWGTYYPNLIRNISKLQINPIIVDSEREKPLYILTAFYQKLDPNALQRLHAFNTDQYYTNTTFVPPVVANVTMRNIVWEQDLSKEQYLIADQLAISKDQVEEHRLKLVDTVVDIYNQPVLFIYKTQPKL